LPTITDLGQTGPDKGAGGKYLILPPGATPSHHGGVVVTAVSQGVALHGIVQVEEIKFLQPDALLKGG
jgi:hypothetical protein